MHTIPIIAPRTFLCRLGKNNSGIPEFLFTRLVGCLGEIGEQGIKIID